MLISRKILQSYFDAPLPDSDVIARELTLKSYEVEGIEKTGSDEVFDIDILPNRASDSLSHIGVAREVGIIFGLTPNFSSEKVQLEEVSPDSIDLTVEEDTASRFMAVAISGLETGETPAWMKEALEALGERSINPIVDVTNYVMITIGQPLHAYDADIIESISGGASLSTSFAKAGEKLTLLDGAEINLMGEELLIRTGERPLALAGVKGGLESGVTSGTTRILLESASFDPKAVRRTAKLAKLQTGGSKRFENGVPADLVASGVELALSLLSQIYGAIKVDALRDHYPSPSIEPEIELEKGHPARLLGIEIAPEDIILILEKIGAKVKITEDNFLITPPWFRPDIKIAVDVIEEVGRLYGLTKIQAEELTPKAVAPERSTIAKEIAREILIKKGYSEIITRAFRKEGEVELANPLATDAPFLRADMISGVGSALELASQNSELLEIGYAKIFEIGTVFSKEEESLHLTVGIQKTKNAHKKLDPEAEILAIEKSLSEKFGVVFGEHRSGKDAGNTSLIVEYDLERIITLIDLMPQAEPVELRFNHYREFSIFPYVLRDIALWTPEGTTPESVEQIIRDHASDLLQVVSLFDRFEKEVDGVKQVSYAFRLVFQSFEKTLSDEEVNHEMELISSALSREKDFNIR